MNIHFSDNKAEELGSDLLGGVLDRCTASQYAEVYVQNTAQLFFTEVDMPLGLRYKGISYIGSISNITLDSIASLPVQVLLL